VGSSDSNPSNNMYIKNHRNVDASTKKDSECVSCSSSFCSPGQHFNNGCGELTNPECSLRKIKCGGCITKSQGDCVGLCVRNDDAGECNPDHVMNEYIDPSSKYDGTSFEDTYVCRSCDDVVVPPRCMIVSYH